MGYQTNTHDCCIYWKVINGEVIYLLRHTDNFCAAFIEKKTAENLFNILGTKMRFKSEEEKGIIPFEVFGEAYDFNGVYIKQTSQYIEMSYEYCIHCLSKSHDWETKKTPSSLANKENSITII